MYLRRHGKRYKVRCQCNTQPGRWTAPGHVRHLADLESPDAICPRCQVRRWIFVREGGRQR